MKKWALSSMILVALFSLLGYFQFANNHSIKNDQYKIGVLITGSERLEKIDGLKEGLQSLGYLEGMNLSFIIKNADNQRAKIKSYAKELDQMDLDVIIAGGAIEAQYLNENKEGKTPVIFLGVADAVALNLIEGYQKPNGRLTGVENDHVALSAKRLQLFKMLLPATKRFIVLYDEKVDASLLSLQQVKQIAEDEQIDIFPMSVSNIEQLNNLKTYSFNLQDGILVLPSYFLEKASPTLGELALEKKVPIFGVQASDIKQGFLLSYGVSYHDQGYQCASMVSQILQGQAPGNIPVEKPDTVRLLVNAQTERSLNVQFSNVGNAFIQRME